MRFDVDRVVVVVTGLSTLTPTIYMNNGCLPVSAGVLPVGTTVDRNSDLNRAIATEKVLDNGY
jgi:hypothetical protein